MVQVWVLETKRFCIVGTRDCLQKSQQCEYYDMIMIVIKQVCSIGQEAIGWAEYNKNISAYLLIAMMKMMR